MDQKLTASDHLRREASRSVENAMEEAKIADALDKESAKRREAASDWRHHADQLIAAANRLDAAAEAARVVIEGRF